LPLRKPRSKPAKPVNPLRLLAINRRRKSAAGSVVARPLAIKKDPSPLKEIRQEKSQQLLAFVDGKIWVSNRAGTALFDAKAAKALVKAGNLTT
jgi:hypothetical protein